MKQKDIVLQEFNLNVKHQNIQVKEFTTVGYEYDDGVVICCIMIPKLKQLLKDGNNNN